MHKKIFFKILIIFTIPIYILAQNIEEKPVKLIKNDVIQVSKKESVNTTNLKKLEEEQNEKETLTKEPQSEIEKQLALQNKLLEEIINNINNEKFLTLLNNSKSINKELKLLTNKINVNKKEKNILAVKRDELRVLFLKEKKLYEDTLKNIIKAKQEFKDKKYFQTILTNAIETIQNNKIENYTSLYEKESKGENKISKAFTNNYVELYNQNHTQVFVLEYLFNNMPKYRKTNFIIDEFNLQYLVKQIDSLTGISFVSGLTSYYLKFSIGEIIVVLFIILVFRLLSSLVISLIANVIAKFFVKDEHEDSKAIHQYLKMSIGSPLIYILYTLSIQISILILIKDPVLISKIMPWVNTVYMAIFTWALYAIINNSINIYANKLLVKYPNVRKELIVFILKIIKIILILFVILFLFSQLGIDIKAIAASLGVGGIAIALASKDTLANFFGSLNIMTDNSFSQGDWIKTSEVEGTVVDIRMRTTRIRTFDNAMITVPNSELANTPIMNWSKRKIGRRIKMHIGITYESKIEDIENLKNDIYTMLSEHQDIASAKNIQQSNSRRFEAIKKEDLEGVKRTLLVYIDGFSASSIDILVYCFSRSPNWEDWLITKENVLIQIAQLAKKNNCEFAYPTQTLFVKKDSEINTLEDN